MQITPTKQSTNFKAKLYTPNKIEIKEFANLKKGSDATKILVDSFFVKPTNNNNFNHFALLFVHNPLFGFRCIEKKVRETEHAYYFDKNTEDRIDMDKLIGVLIQDCESIENEAFEQALTKEITAQDKLKKKNKKILSVWEIYSKMLSQTTPEAHGFSDKRLKDFENIADNI